MRIRSEVCFDRTNKAHLPGHKVTADVEENKEAFVVGGEGSVRTEAAPLLSQALQIDHVHVNLFSYGRRRHGV